MKRPAVGHHPGIDIGSSGEIHNGLVLRPGAPSISAGTVAWKKGELIALPSSTEAASAGACMIDAAGAWVLPGIVDIHGDAFERSIMPRGGVPFDTDLALADNDAQLLASGITTAFLSATDSWEPGLRSRETLRELVAALDRRADSAPDVRLHVRHERCNTEDLDELIGWISDGTVSLLSYNDHTPGGISMVRDIKAPQLQRCGVDLATLTKLRDGAVSRRPLGLEQEQQLAEVTAAAGCATASHDASDDSDLRRDLDLGVAIAEFPMSIPLAKQYLAEGIDVLLGAPNAYRGGSHLGNLSVRKALAAQAGTLLCSDYHYPSLAQAPFALADLGVVPFADAWAAVCERPARAAGLDDRGRIEPGMRADLVVIEPPAGTRPAKVRTVVVGGSVVFQR